MAGWYWNDVQVDSNYYVAFVAVTQAPYTTNSSCYYGTPPPLRVQLHPEMYNVAQTYNMNYCKLCKSNRECRQVYTSHALHDDEGRVICPILRQYVCPICSATGDNAHTVKYCPKNHSPRIDSLRFQQYKKVRSATGVLHSLKY